MAVITRRTFLSSSSTLAGLAAIPLASGCATTSKTTAEPTAHQPVSGTRAQAGAVARPAQTVDVVLNVNGTMYPLQLDARTTLLDALREKVGLTGTKKGCDQGQCGACTVHLDGARVLSCFTLAASVGDRRVTTIEGLATVGGLHPMQQAFIDHDAFQCGYCTPGQIMSAVACVNEGHAQTSEQIREYMSGNLCRCAAYPNIVAAIEQARALMKKGA